MSLLGTYQAYYETGILANSSPSDISWIGSIQAFLLMFVGAITGSIYDAGYVHSLMLVGSFLVVFGQMMLSLATSYYQVVLAQAICIGIGCGCLFVPGVAILSTYFSTKIATAMGIAASGSSLGGVIYPIVFHRLQPTIGFPWATRVIGFIALFGLAISNLTLRVRTIPDSRRKFLDLAAFKEPPYALFVLGTFLGFMGLYVVFFYVQTYAIQDNITNENMAFYLLSVLNAGSVFGRIIPNYIADRTGPLNMIIPCALMSGVLALCLIAAHSLAPVIVICALYGFFSGSFVSLPPTILVHLTANRAMIGTRMGMCFTGTCAVLLSLTCVNYLLTLYHSCLHRLAGRYTNLGSDSECDWIYSDLGFRRCACHCRLSCHRSGKSGEGWLGLDGQGLEGHEFRVRLCYNLRNHA
jgi:MFS family permease